MRFLWSRTSWASREQSGNERERMGACPVDILLVPLFRDTNSWYQDLIGWMMILAILPAEADKDGICGHCTVHRRRMRGYFEQFFSTFSLHLWSETSAKAMPGNYGTEAQCFWNSTDWFWEDSNFSIGHFRVPFCLCFKASLKKWLLFAWKRNCVQNSFSYERFRT